MKQCIIILLIFFISDYSNAQNADTLLIRKHLLNIIETEQPRNYKNIEVLNYVAGYLYNEFSKYADSTYYQTYLADGKEYKNVVCVFGNENEKTIIVGAHYDVCGDQDGADDNASGVVGLLELARLLDGKKLNHRIEIVAYSLEEPPYFRTEQMGSFIHAKSVVESKKVIYGMVCLEMIGYFDDTKGSQDYPLGILSLFYGKRGNYITLVSKFGKGKFARKFNAKFKRQRNIKTKKFIGPPQLQGIDFSDHLNYWKFGISALMITDTAFYRNKNYHEKTDTIETLDFHKMSKVIDSVYTTLVNLK